MNNVQARRFLPSPVPPPVIWKSFLGPEWMPPGEMKVCVPLHNQTRRTLINLIWGLCYHSTPSWRRSTLFSLFSPLPSICYRQQWHRTPTTGTTQPAPSPVGLSICFSSLKYWWLLLRPALSQQLAQALTLLSSPLQEAPLRTSSWLVTRLWLLMRRTWVKPPGRGS